ncbi:MAG: nucleoside triphosphate pyrophosphohydrolase [Deltaproteobacteria bacterium]|nr:nucleoside triphosphate pyrophosphohydrolase [Deltaproteobacteria bacterium]
MIEKLQEIVQRLRAADGCPWDRQQTPESIKNYILEEAYEVADAVENKSPPQVAEELGDLLFMAVFLANLYMEKHCFSLDDVLQGAKDKMIRRHPHVFGEQRLESSEEVRENWEKIKQRERADKTLASALEAVPRTLPALMRTHRVLAKFRRALHRPLGRELLAQELAEAVAAITASTTHESSSPAKLLGKALFLAVALHLEAKIKAEEALSKTVSGFSKRIGQLEVKLQESGRTWQDFSEKEEKDLWHSL